MADDRRDYDDFEDLAAVALGYDIESDSAPYVLAKGKGFLARKIIEVAEAHDIPIRQNRDLVAILSKLSLRDEISEEVYPVIAEILSYIYRMNNSYVPEEGVSGG